MEDDGTKDAQHEIGKKTPDGAANIRASTTTNASKKSEKQTAPSKSKRWTLRQHWQRASPAERTKWIFEGIGALIALLILANYVWQNLQIMWNFRAEHAPLIIHSRPPEFLQTYKCIPAERIQQNAGSIQFGQLQLGDIDIIYKNIGNGTAYDVGWFPFNNWAVIPVKRTGIAIYDEGIQVTPKDCTHYFMVRGAPLEPGVEGTVHIASSGPTVPPQVKDGDLVRFEEEICTPYADRYGNRHETCDLYELSTRDVPNLQSAEKILGTANLPCDGVERTAHFEPLIAGHCQE
jgi:hypothetical protein